MQVYCACELVDVAAGFSEALVGSCCLLLYCGDEAVGNSVCGVLEVATLIYAEDGFS